MTEIVVAALLGAWACVVAVMVVAVGLTVSGDLPLSSYRALHRWLAEAFK